MKKQKSIAVINDVSGFGRCSITVALPILSAMKISCGIIPTAILSNQTEYPEYTMLDFTNHMEEYIKTWQRLQFSFDGLYTGFLGSTEQIQIISHMMDNFAFKKVIIDPVMGDHGVLYDSYDENMCRAMKEFIYKATVILPNVTELCILTDREYSSNLSLEYIESMCRSLIANASNHYASNNTLETIVVTGIEEAGKIGTAYFHNNEFFVYWQERIEPLRPGTGDVFASILAGCILQDMDLQESISLASNYVKTCLETSKQFNVPLNDGVCFEEHLSILTNLF